MYGLARFYERLHTDRSTFSGNLRNVAEHTIFKPSAGGRVHVGKGKCGNGKKSETEVSEIQAFRAPRYRNPVESSFLGKGPSAWGSNA